MATVFVWNNNKVGFSSHKYPGHASMNIDDEWKFSGSVNYVSFWPKDDSRLFSPTSKAVTHIDLKSDFESEGGYTPDHIIRIKGLSKDLMLAEWALVKKEYKNYQMLRHNCASAVARVLKAGGKGGSAWRRHSVVWTPLNVKRLALAMGGTKMKWHDLLDEMVKGGALTFAAAHDLRNNLKRDARHGIGSATSSAMHSGGQRIGPSFMVARSWAAPSPPMSSGSMVGASLATIFDTIDALGGDEED